MEETKIIYHIDDEDTPYLIRLPIPPEKATLGDFKNELNRPNYKFFFKSVDADFGVVKEEITDDNASLPCCNGRVVSWLVSADAEGSVHSENQQPQQQQSLESGRGAAGSGAAAAAGGAGGDDNGCDSCTDSESVYSASQRGDRVAPLRSFNDYRQHAQRINVGRVYNSRHHHHHHHNQAGGGGGSQSATYESASSMLSSDLDTTSFFDSEDDAESSRFSSATNTTYSMGAGPNSRLNLQNRQRHKRRRRGPPISRTSSFSSITESAFSLNVQTVELDMDAVQFLGISIVGHPAVNGGSGGIYVGSIMRGGAVEREGSIQPGDMLLEVNGVTFENLENDEAVRILREQVQKPGKITLVVAKCWDSRDYLRVPREEPVRPIDPRAWVLHTNAMRQDPSASGGGGGGGSSQVTPAASCMGGENLCDSRLTVTAASVSTSSCSLPESERYTTEELLPPLTTRTDLLTIVKAMAMSESGLEVRDRTWLKITIPRAFIGSDLVDWLYSRVDGFSERKEARKMALDMLKRGYIRHTVNKVSFSEQCYYVFGDCIAQQPHLQMMMDSAQHPLPTLGMSKLNLMEGGAGGDMGMPPPPQPQPPQQYPMGLMSTQQQQQHQQQQQQQQHHQIPPPPPQGAWGAPPPSYPSLYGTTDSESVSQYSSVMMQQQHQGMGSTPMGGAMPPANSATVVSDNSDSSSASSRSRSSIPMTIPPSSQSAGVHLAQQQQQQQQMSHNFSSSNSGIVPTVSTASVAWKHAAAPVWQ